MPWTTRRLCNCQTLYPVAPGDRVVGRSGRRTERVTVAIESCERASGAKASVDGEDEDDDDDEEWKTMNGTIPVDVPDAAGRVGG